MWGSIVTLDPCPQPWEQDGTWDVRVSYHADRSRHGVLMPNLAAGVELAFLENRGYSGVTADDIESAEFSSEVVDRAFEDGLVILVRTDATTVFKLGLATEDAAGLSFDYGQL